MEDLQNCLPFLGSHAFEVLSAVIGRFKNIKIMFRKNSPYLQPTFTLKINKAGSVFATLETHWQSYSSMTLKFSLSFFSSASQHSPVSGVLMPCIWKQTKLKQFFPVLAISKEMQFLRKTEISGWKKSSCVIAGWRLCAWILEDRKKKNLA